MIELQSVLDAILDDPLAQARASGRALAYVGFDLPTELLMASQRHVCHLPWDADRKTPAADRWLERSFAPWTRSMLELWLEGRFDFFEHVVFSRGDDSAHRLYYYVCELQRRGLLDGPTPLIFDVAKVPRASSARHTIAAVRRLAERLEIGDQQLRNAIDAANRRRKLYADLEAARGAPGSLYERIARATLFADLDDVLRTAALEDRVPRRRVLLAGSAPPDDRLHMAIEATGWVVSGEWHERTLQRCGPENRSHSDDPAAAIGSHAHRLAVGARSFADRASSLVDAARGARADAVILWLIEEDEALPWGIPAQRAALSAAGIPALIATRRRWDARDGIAEEIAEFLATEDLP
jgi:hypothetical protein